MLVTVCIYAACTVVTSERVMDTPDLLLHAMNSACKRLCWGTANF